MSSSCEIFCTHCYAVTFASSVNFFYPRRAISGPKIYLMCHFQNFLLSVTSFPNTNGWYDKSQLGVWSKGSKCWGCQDPWKPAVCSNDCSLPASGDQDRPESSSAASQWIWLSFPLNSSLFSLQRPLSALIAFFKLVKICWRYSARWLVWYFV